MKVVFPCAGSLVLLKQDLETLQAFYNTTLLTSKLLDAYKTANVSVQVGNFNYISIRSSILLDNVNLLSIEKMRDILGIHEKTPSNETNSANTVSKDALNNEQISDKDLLSNPFFQTLKMLN